VLRILLVADTHLGFDLPARPRSQTLRRGRDFFTRFREALAPARRGEVDLVVHGGDLLFRSRVPVSLVMESLEPLLDVADRGVPVVVVPGNHERSALPYPLLAVHDHLHVLNRPRTVRLRLAGLDVAVSGFPCERDDIRNRFPELLAATRWQAPADIRLLCLHQTVEGATVGPSDFVFRGGPDVLPAALLPGGFAAVLAGHIHRHQVLTRDLARRTLAAPVIYPGSTERTSFAERAEPKGFVVLDVEPTNDGGRLAGLAFHELQARPMAVVEIRVTGLGPEALAGRLAERLGGLPPESAVLVRCRGRFESGSEKVLRAGTLRTLHPPGMMVSVRVLPDDKSHAQARADMLDERAATRRTRNSSPPARAIEPGRPGQARSER
jgi:exonuclease SbcD